MNPKNANGTKYFRLCCGSTQSALSVEQENIHEILRLCHTALAFNSMAETDTYPTFAHILPNGTIVELPKIMSIYDAFNYKNEENEYVAYIGGRNNHYTAAGIKTKIATAKDVINPPTFFKMKIYSSTTEGINNESVAVVYAVNGIRPSYRSGIIDVCARDAAAFVTVRPIKGSNHLVHYCNIDSYDQDAPITYKNCIIDTLDYNRIPIHYKSSFSTTPSIEGDIIHTDCFDVDGTPSTATINAREWNYFLTRKTTKR